MDRKRNLFGALGLALVGTLLLVGYVRTAEGRASSDVRLVPVVVLRHDVAQGASTTELRDNASVVEVPAAVRASGALRSLDQLGGRVPATKLFAGEQLLGDRLGKVTAVGAALPAGTSAIGLSLDPERALGGRVRPGARVDVLVSYDDPDRTETVLRDVLVQGVGKSEDGLLPKDITKLATGTGTAMLVTLATPDADAEKLVFAADHGRIWLAGTSLPDEPEVAR